MEDNWLEESVKAFEKHINSLSKEELDAIVAEIDAMGIEGPTIEEYLESLNHINDFLL